MPADIKSLPQSFSNYRRDQRFNGEPAALYQPFEYILSIGGKRTRPLLVLMGYELFGKDAHDIFPQAMAVELFHNFTLVHDDIMDNATLRRGAETVHTKFGLPAAILSGDAMLVYAYRYLAQGQSERLPRLLELFNAMAIGVCEGQQSDLVFESRSDVTSEEYIRMIEQKTALLLGAALEIGAELADATRSDAHNLFCFGINTGIAFQLLDDLLDAFGDEERVGKTSGGDIVQNKKTILYLEALSQADSHQGAALRKLYDDQAKGQTEKIAAVKELMVQTGALERTRGLVAHYHQKALACLDAVSVPEENKETLRAFSEALMQRTH